MRFADISKDLLRDVPLGLLCSPPRPFKGSPCFYAKYLEELMNWVQDLYGYGYTANEPKFFVYFKCNDIVHAEKERLYRSYNKEKDTYTDSEDDQFIYKLPYNRNAPPFDPATSTTARLSDSCIDFFGLYYKQIFPFIFTLNYNLGRQGSSNKRQLKKGIIQYGINVCFSSGDSNRAVKIKNTESYTLQPLTLCYVDSIDLSDPTKAIYNIKVAGNYTHRADFMLGLQQQLTAGQEGSVSIFTSQNSFYGSLDITKQNTGSSAIVQYSYNIVEAFTENSWLYLGNDGQLTDKPPQSGFCQLVGFRGKYFQENSQGTPSAFPIFNRNYIEYINCINFPVTTNLLTSTEIGVENFSNAKKLQQDCGISDGLMNLIRPTYPSVVKTYDNRILFIDCLAAKKEGTTTKKTFLGKYTILDSNGIKFDFDRIYVSSAGHLYLNIFTFYKNTGEIVVYNHNLRLLVQVNAGENIKEIIGVVYHSFISPSTEPDFLIRYVNSSNKIHEITNSGNTFLQNLALSINASITEEIKFIKQAENYFPANPSHLSTVPYYLSRYPQSFVYKLFPENLKQVSWYNVDGAFNLQAPEYFTVGGYIGGPIQDVYERFSNVLATKLPMFVLDNSGFLIGCKGVNYGNNYDTTNFLVPNGDNLIIGGYSRGYIYYSTTKFVINSLTGETANGYINADGYYLPVTQVGIAGFYGVNASGAEVFDGGGALDYLGYDFHSLFQFINEDEFDKSNLSMSFCEEPYNCGLALDINNTNALYSNYSCLENNNLEELRFYTSYKGSLINFSHLGHNEVLVLGDPYGTQTEYNTFISTKNRPTSYNLKLNHVGIPPIKFRLIGAPVENQLTTPENQDPDRTYSTELALINDHKPFQIIATDSYTDITDPICKDDNGNLIEENRVLKTVIKVWPRTLPKSKHLTDSSINFSDNSSLFSGLLLSGPVSIWANNSTFNNSYCGVILNRVSSGSFTSITSLLFYGKAVGDTSMLIKTENGIERTISISIWDVLMKNTANNTYETEIPDEFTFDTQTSANNIYYFGIVGNSSYSHRWHSSDTSVAKFTVNADDTRYAVLEIVGTGEVILSAMDSAEIPWRTNKITVS